MLVFLSISVWKRKFSGKFILSIRKLVSTAFTGGYKLHFNVPLCLQCDIKQQQQQKHRVQCAAAAFCHHHSTHDHTDQSQQQQVKQPINQHRLHAKIRFVQLPSMSNVKDLRSRFLGFRERTDQKS